MDSDLNWIENYINSLHRGDRKPEMETEVVPPPPPPPQKENPKISLDVSILQQRIDSVSVIKYYKDLKNDRLKLNDKITIVNEDQLFQNMTAHDESKPWNKQDRYTKIKRINLFINKLIQQNSELDKKIISAELIEMLDSKKINKKNTDFDQENNIIKMGNYCLSST
jgi:hypothetical protein